MKGGWCFKTFFSDCTFRGLWTLGITTEGNIYYIHVVWYDYTANWKSLCCQKNLTYRHPVILLMVQKSHSQPPEIYIKPCKSWDFNYQLPSTGELNPDFRTINRYILFEVWKVDLCFRYVFLEGFNPIDLEVDGWPFGWRESLDLFLGILPWPLGLRFLGWLFFVSSKSSPFCLKITVNHLIIYGLQMFGSQSFFGNLIMLIMQIQSCYLLCRNVY